MDNEIVLTRYADALDAYRRKELGQAQYDEGHVLMAGVLVNLHGTEHRDRRRVENQLFRRETFLHYEKEVFPDVTAAVLAPHARRGATELVALGHELMLHLAVLVAGVDRPEGTEAETRRLAGQLKVFIEALTLAQSTLDKDERRAAIADAFTDWRREFLTPSARRRRALLAGLADGTVPERQLPRDVLTLLLRHQDRLGLSDELIARETAFFLLVAAHTSATAFVRAVHHLLEWTARHPEDARRAADDPRFAQRCVHETIRLNPSSTVGMRRALAPVTLESGITVPEGARVVIDLRTVNRDPAAYGPDAAEFDPHREIAPGVMPFGLSFAAGMHVCIGQDLAAGVLQSGSGPDASLYGLVATAVRELFALGVRRDPAAPPVRDTTTTREYWARYPVLLG
ncbi:cytochrome P450 [Streptantibioticus cattleyicolor]|uniref:Cytochrome P450-like protein n=1 Tax=Streptantibioticus cattleyicolor (strain ATCC 35852 / DSM 46488 / JCM 4925 / NBRC 14057 / NRRL 8057) TaxID=1003195 RepID=F8JMR1_STREN|nr:cytochrome P450 [Streptantibioticus cattleyicolor]AEW99304.1 cytochrome P450-like protein [Streptantibioticus cattleyicolor NRRL 8057 = DSM 46488]CCB71657.1 Cytochrome P450-like protein [Streptantibioticus cattleyicolor NRRL 8057 = DSM 46488]